MFDKSLLGHGALALVSAAVAFAAWSAPTTVDSPRAKPKLLAGNLGALNRVVWRETSTKDVETTVEVLRNEAGALDVTVTRTGEPVKAFPGTQKASDLIESLASFEGDRALGSLDESERRKFGLEDERAKRLTLGFDRREIEVKVGSEAYGTGSYYVSPPSGEVFLVSSRVLSPLRHGAGVLLDRRLIGVERDAIRRVVIQVGDLERELVHRYPDDRSKSFYADPAEPDVRLEQASGWLDRALRLRTVSVVDTEPVGAPALILRVFGAGDAIAEAQIWRKDDAGKAYARSSRFGRTLELSPSGVERLLSDAATVLEERGE